VLKVSPFRENRSETPVHLLMAEAKISKTQKNNKNKTRYIWIYKEWKGRN